MYVLFNIIILYLFSFEKATVIQIFVDFSFFSHSVNVTFDDDLLIVTSDSINILTVIKITIFNDKYINYNT